MKSPLSHKSFCHSNSSKSFDPPDHSSKRTKTNLSSVMETQQRSASQIQYRSNPHIKLLPEQKRKNHITLFNFFINKGVKKSQSQVKSFQKECKELKEPKRYIQQESFIIKKIKGPNTSLSTQKIQMFQSDSQQKLRNFIQTNEKRREEVSPSKFCTDRNLNKINESLVKNTKFDRKKYMYYRYRKRNSPQKNNVSFNQSPDNDEFLKPKPVKTPFNKTNMKTDGQLGIIYEKNSGKDVEYKYTFYEMLPPKYKSFSEVKCKLTIEPFVRQTSYKLIDRNSLAKTTRQMKDKKYHSPQNPNKIFPQAVHFKSRKTPTYKSPTKQNPQKKQKPKKQEQILGWNLGQQHLIQEQYF